MHTHTRAHTAQSRVSPRPSPRTAPRVPGSQAERSTRHGGHVAAGQTWLICSASGKCILGSQLGLSRAQDDSTAPPRRPQADCRGEGRNGRRNGRDRQGQPPSTRAAPAPPPAPFRAFPSSFSFLSIQSHRLVFCTVGVFLFRSLTFVFFTLRVNETVSCSSFSGSLRVASPPLGPLVLSRAARRHPLCGRVLCQRTHVPLLYSGLRQRDLGPPRPGCHK